MERLARLDRRRMQRVALVIAAVGATLVFVAIFTNDKATVAVGLVLMVIAHVLLFLAGLSRRPGAGR